MKQTDGIRLVYQAFAFLSRHTPLSAHRLTRCRCRTRARMHNSRDWEFARPLCLHNYRDGYYAQLFVTAVIIWQDNELVNNVIPFARRVRVGSSGAASGENSDVRYCRWTCECWKCNLFLESQVPTIGWLQVSRRIRALSGGILPRREIP